MSEFRRGLQICISLGDQDEIWDTVLESEEGVIAFQLPPKAILRYAESILVSWADPGSPISFVADTPDNPAADRT